MCHYALYWQDWLTSALEIRENISGYKHKPCISVCMCLCMHVCVWVSIYIHMHIYTYLYTQETHTHICKTQVFMIYSRYSVDALVIPTSTCWVHGSQPKVCTRDKIQYIWHFFPCSLTNKAQPSLLRVLREEDEGEPWSLPGCFFTSYTKDDLEGEPWPARVCFYILSLTNSLQLWSKQQIHLYVITNVNTFRVMRILEASAGLCLWQHWLAEPEELHNMPLIQERDHDITVTWDISFLAEFWLRSSEGQVGLWSIWFV